MPSAVLNPPILSPFVKNASPPTATTTAATTPPSPSNTPLNLSDLPLQLTSLCQRTSEISQRQASISSDDGGDEGIYIPERGELEENEEEEYESEQVRVGHSNHNHRSPATEFSASNLAQSSPSPPSSLHFGGSPSSASRCEEGKTVGGEVVA